MCLVLVEIATWVWIKTPAIESGQQSQSHAIAPYFPPAAQKLEMRKTRGLAAFQKGAWTQHLAAPIAPSLCLEKSPAIVSSKQTYNWGEHVISHSYSLFLQKMLKDARSKKTLAVDMQLSMAPL